MIDNNVIGNYIINPKRIGKGAFSSVYLGKDKYNNNVAVKKMEIDNVKKISDRIKGEIEICEKLDHKNVISTFDVIYDNPNGCIYIISEYCSKGDLSQFLKSRSMKEKYALYFMKQIRDGLKYLLDNKIFHRDLKPHNILIDENGELKIADFGFARHFERDNMMETLCGTPLYMAPEIMNKKKYSNKSDLWSVGIILYQMLFGKRPHDATNIFDLLKSIENNPIVFPSSYNVSDEVKDLLLKLLCKNPDERISWNDFINHPWFQKEEQINNSILKKKDVKKDETKKDDKSKILTSLYKFGSSIASKIKKNKVDESVIVPVEKTEKLEFLDEKKTENIPIPKPSRKTKPIVDDSPMFTYKPTPSLSDDFVLISNSDIKMLDKTDKDNFMDKEEDSDEENDHGRYHSNSVKDTITNSLDYLKNSITYLTLYKNGSL